MSIIIKSNELNTIVYKYLLQAGLSHSAYTFFNEAKLESSLQQFKYDIKSGHLLMLLEKGLILSQIEAHVNFGEYQECLEPFSILKPHTCKITEKLKTDQNNFLKELNSNITECIRRTNAIYNTELTNKNYEEIVYEPRGMNYFEKFEKFRIIDGDQIENQTDLSREKIIKIDGEKDNVMAVWNRVENIVYLTQNDSIEETIVSKIYPCILNGQIEPLQTFKLTPNEFIMVFTQNRTRMISRSDDGSLEFSIPLRQPIVAIECNANIPNLINFQSSSEYFVFNTKNMEEVMKGQGLLRWRGFDEYIVFEQGVLLMKSLVKKQPLITYNPLEIDQKPCFQVDELEISPNKTFFYLVSYKRNKIWVYTFQKQQPLYVFDFEQDEEELKKVIWAHRNEVDYLCMLSDLALRVWEVELNAYCLKIDLQKYELGEVISISSLEKNENQTFLMALGSQNLLVSDIANQKIERIESPINVNQMSNIGKNSVFVSTDQNVYFLDGHRLAELFK